MLPRLLVALASLPLVAWLLHAEHPAPVAAPPESPAVESVGPNPVRVTRMVEVTRTKKVPYTVCRMVPYTEIVWRSDGKGGSDGVPVTRCKPVYETCYKDVTETVLVPQHEYIERAAPPPDSIAPTSEAAPAPAAVIVAEPIKPSRSKELEEAIARLRLYPRDSYLQFVVLQMARREGCLVEVVAEVEQIAGIRGRGPGAERRDAIDLFSIFTGALAVQESLQLDTLRGEDRGGRTIVAATPAPTPVPAPEPIPAPRAQAEDAASAEEAEVIPVMPREDDEAAPAAYPSDPPPPAPLESELATIPLPTQGPVAIGELNGPKVKSHPWKKMLARQQPDIEPLARMVPHDFAYVHFRSLTKLLDAAELADQWTTHFGSQAFREARTGRTRERLLRQLALEFNPELRPLYDNAVEDVTVVGSDPFIHEGSDVTLLMHYHRPVLFRLYMQAFLARAARSRPDAVQSAGTYMGVKYAHIATPDRSICVYAAYPAPHVHVRSNSLVALERVIDAIHGQTVEGKPVKRLGDTAEFKYIRTLYPLEAEEEDGLVYLSDPFIRRLVGPQVKLTERRRMLCYNHLRMIGHAAMLYRTEHGSPPESLDALVEADCLPFAFAREIDAIVKERIPRLLADLECDDEALQDQAATELEKLGSEIDPERWAMLGSTICIAERIETVVAKWKTASHCRCPHGGTYALTDDGMTGTCSCHGHAHFLTPNIEVPLTEITGPEADEYKAFLREYEQYWRTYFDPIAIRVAVTPERYRLETIVLPLIDNSIYTGLATVLGGPTDDLDALPVPARNIFSMTVRFNKEALLNAIAPEVPAEEEAAEGAGAEPYKSKLVLPYADILTALGVPKGVLDGPAGGKLDIIKFLRDGIGSQIGLHLYDAPPNFDFNFPGAMGLLMQVSGGGNRGENAHLVMLAGFTQFFYLAGIGASFNGPAYVSIPVKDAKVVDEFGDQLERIFAALARATDNATSGLVATGFYRLPFKNDRGRMMRTFTVRLGPLKLRYFWARIGSAVYIASQPCVLEDLLALEKVEKRATPQAAHALFTIRARNWNEVLDNTYLGWAENHREACINNQGPLSSVARAFTASLGKIDEQELAQVAGRIVQEADRLHQVHFFCPEGGCYVLSPDGKQMTCSVHGSALEPRQPVSLSEDTPLGKHLRGFGGLTATLTFMKEGLRAVVEIERN
jgi:hypothetical protein